MAGLPQHGRVSAAGTTGVLVVDQNGAVGLYVQDPMAGVLLTAEQADLLAEKLVGAAHRLRQAATDAPPETAKGK